MPQDQAEIMRSHPREQADTMPVTVREIVTSPEFRAGVDEVRAGRPPAFDAWDDWNYERGRAFAVIAPRNLDPQSDLAVRLYVAARARRYII
jgi:hypothetical protein